MANKVEVIITAKDKATGVISKVAGGIKGMGKSLMGFSLKAVAGGIAGMGALAVGLSKIAIDSAPVQGVIDSFGAITEASGVATASMLKDLQEASLGMITNTDLMKSYNKASMLISDTFANQLPGAMKPLGKVAQATGEDMGYLMDSLVTGVGRLSPMILDNLGIQVSLAEANQAYAESIGKTVSELSKQEQQEALMAQVMDKLAQKTEAMPDAMGSASQMWGQFTTGIKNAKDALGLALLPVLTPVIEKFAEFASGLQPLIQFIQAVVNKGYIFNKEFSALPESLQGPAQKIGELVLKIKDFITSVKGMSLEDIKQKFLSMIPPEIISAIQNIWQGIQNLGQAFASTLPVAKEHVSGLVAFFQERFLPMIANVGQTVSQILNAMALWWANHGEVVIAVIRAFITVISSIFGGLIQLVTGIINAGLQALNGNWSGALEALKGGAIAFVDAILGLFGGSFDSLVKTMSGVWEAMKRVFDLAMSIIRDRIQEKLNPIIKVFQSIKNAITSVIETIQNLAKKLLDIVLPDWLKPGSPTPFEIGLVGIDKAMRQLASSSLPKFNAELGLTSTIGQPLVGAVGAGGPRPGGSVAYVTININGAGDPDAVARSIMRQMRANGVLVS